MISLIASIVESFNLIFAAVRRRRAERRKKRAAMMGTRGV